MPILTLAREATATIRGYIYQFDATIRKIIAMDLTSTLTIEGVEDFDENSGLNKEYSQVKYYAAQKLTDPNIRNAILPMLKGFKTFSPEERATKSFVLYGYFKESVTGVSSLSLEDIKRILIEGYFEHNNGKKVLSHKNLQLELNITDDELSEFISRLKINITEEYLLYKSLTVNELRLALGVGKTEAESYSYPSALTFISEKAATSSVESRTTNKAQFLASIKRSTAIYNEWMLREETEIAYSRKIRLAYFSHLNIEVMERVFIFSGFESQTAKDIEEVVRHIMSKWSTYDNLRKPDKERFAPYIFFPQLDGQTLIDVKQSLVDDGIEITDGYTFLHASINLYMLQREQTSHQRIAIRFIDDERLLEQIFLGMRKKKMIIQLYMSEPVMLSFECRQITIPIDSLGMIKHIL